MIWESWYWKKPLLKTARRLRSFKKKINLGEEELAQIERDIFIGFYTVRKLFETITKVTDETKSSQVQVSWYPNQKKPVNWVNNHRIDELYDLEKQYQETRDVWFICGRIIHSFVYTTCVGEEGGLSGIMFTSDKDKDKKLYSMHIDDVIEIFERVGNDDPVHIEHYINPETGEETTVVK